MTLVVDASVAVKWLVREVLTDQARSLLTIPDQLIAPDWLLVEAASTFWKKVKRSEMLIIHAKRHLRELPDYFEKLHPAGDLIDKALSWSFRLDHSVYDCLYFALAERENAQLVTADDKFVAVLVANGLNERVRQLA